LSVKPPPLEPAPPLPAPADFLPAPAPEGAGEIRFTLKDLVIEGVSVYAPADLRPLYQDRLGQEVSLADLYALAAAITRKYRADGYFLSLALVPDQGIKDGVARIRAIEGYVAEVRRPRGAAEAVLGRYAKALLARRPVTARALESFLLRIDELPKISFRAVLSRAEGAPEGAVVLTLSPRPRGLEGAVSADNYGSRYLGPYELTATVSAGVPGLAETTLSALASVLDPKLSYVALHESLAVHPNVLVSADVAATRAFPGGPLKIEDINSRALSYGLTVTYLWLRQRDLRLAVHAGLDARDVFSDILGQPLTRDHIRAARVGFDLQAETDIGAADANLTLSRGLPDLGESAKGAPDLSRAVAEPSFTKLQFDASDLRALGPDWSILLAAAGQVATVSLYASEAFGYGGQAFGRAYDASEIIGDNGISVSAELRYDAKARPAPLGYQPFVFWDYGAVFDIGEDGPKRQTGSSAGFGVRFSSVWGLGGVLNAAWPVIRPESDPLYFTYRTAPRLGLQLFHHF
jgi:hemolysin activation/secretion protein